MEDHPQLSLHGKRILFGNILFWGSLTKAFASFQCDVDHETDEIIGMGEDDHKDTASLKAIKHLHSQFN